MAPRRPTAFEVSFPEEASQAATVTLRGTSSTSGSSALGKRRNEGPTSLRAGKHIRLPQNAYYTKKKNEIIEDNKLVITGEDPPEAGDAGSDKPIRELYGFSIFDPAHKSELVTLEALEQDDGVDRSFEAAGTVKPHFVSDEDAGQEDEDEAPPQYVRLSAILRYTLDYTEESDPFYIETQYAWYILKTPSRDYKPFFEQFYSPRRIAQIIISRSLRSLKPSAKDLTMEKFLDRFTEQADMFGRSYSEQDIWDSLQVIGNAIREEVQDQRIFNVPLIKAILRKIPNSGPKKSSSGSRMKRMPKNKTFMGNIDTAVLKKENQSTTCVTPRIARLAKGLFREELSVLGPPPPPVNKADQEIRKKRVLAQIRRLLTKANQAKKFIDYKRDDKIPVRADPALYQAVEIDHMPYKIGDVVLLPNPDMMAEMDAKNIEPALGDRVDKFFWFGRIMYIMVESQQAHIQWFNHGSQMIMKELAHPQELFLSDLCGHEDLNNIVGTVKVHFGPTIPKDKSDDYFCKFMHDPKTGVFTDVDIKRLELCENERPPDNCPVCPLHEERDRLLEPRELKDENGIRNGVIVAGTCYHLEDFVLYRAEKGPANIGHITECRFTKKAPKVMLRKVGRIDDLVKIFPEGFAKDERQLFLTDETILVDVKLLLKVVYAPCLESLDGEGQKLDEWLDLSYDHFYITYTCPTLTPQSWGQMKKLKWDKLSVCTPCCQDVLSKRKNMKKFLAESKGRLAVLDLFGGVGAFSRGLTEGSGNCLKVTHAIEIGPSAAKTFARNSPDTIVYNQCANEMLRYAVKTHEGHEVDVPNEKYDDKTPVQPPPKPGEIDVITAGFPCQTHSSLNMYINPDDIKSNLILTTLSYIDFYSPKFIYFENVPGFLRFSLRATHINEYHPLDLGPVEMGGMKLVIRYLIDMDYQLRFGLLQAAHYGTPQRRIRFFLVGAKRGQVLPELPQPTHDYPDSTSLSIKYDVKQDPLTPIRMGHGFALHPCVTIEDAIGDLPRFDWRHPDPAKEPSEIQKRRRKREQKERIPSIPCKTSESYCGYSGKVGYHSTPKTRFQKTARLKETTNIQQFTKCLIPEKVLRVLHIPLIAGADYLSLPVGQYEWSFADPTSSVAKQGYRKGIYGRLDKDNVFPTTVTNIDPTAKQSQVLNPFCYRMITVRELARSQGLPDAFVFESIGDNVVTIHRQIGNAVPLPVAHALGRELRESLFKLWSIKRENMIIIEDDDPAEATVNERQQLGEPSERDDDSDNFEDMYMD